VIALSRRNGRRVRVRYSFKNDQPQPVELWLSLPPDGVGQVVEDVCIEPLGVIRARRADLTGLNEVAYLVLGPGVRIDMTALVQTQRRLLSDVATDRTIPTGLASEERRWFLRSTPLAPADGIVATEAIRIAHAADAEDDYARAWALFSELALNYVYVYPPARRGATAMLETRAGDCGEFAFLFSAWCRSLDIPARSIVGTWARGKTQAHVWNEFHIDGVGWIPADPSMAALAHYHPSQIWLMGRRPGPWQRFFGALPGDRVAFSIDADMPLDPPFAPVGEGGEPDIEMGGRPLRWGRDTLDGAAPYLQPAYPRFPQPPREPPATRWDDQEPLGSWRILPPKTRSVAATSLSLTGVILLVVGGVVSQSVELGAIGRVALPAGVAAWLVAWLMRR
jgi:transglutaminase-like putative cysteine protease